MARPHADRSGCSEFRRTLARPDRRGFVTAGLLGAAGLSLSNLLRAEAKAGTKAKRENSVIILWMRGGPPQHDMWDPKPDAPDGIRSIFQPIDTSVPGIRVTDMLPLTAKLMHKWSIIRSLHHQDAGHSTGDQICFTGYPSGPRPDENHRPSIGSIVSKQLGHKCTTMPPYVMIPKMNPGCGSAYLGPTHKPFETRADPAEPGPFKLQNFDLPEGITTETVHDRKNLLAGFDDIRKDLDADGQLGAADRFRSQAWDILTSPTARDAFDLDKEPKALRERYGFQPAYDPGTPDRCSAPAWSQRILLARRLIEAGVRLVTVDVRWWDFHVKGFESMKDGFLPRWDKAYSALIEDLDQRGLLDTTLVLSWGEFGRTPKINKDAGRDHYPGVFSAALAGGPIKGGRVVGSSDANGAFPKANPKRPQDVLATVYRHLGIDTETNYLDGSGRPLPVLPFGTPIDELC
jgi:hypothetical protein